MKKAQFWYADFLLGLLILVFITIVFTRTIVDLNSKEDKLKELINDGTSTANSFMSQGYCPTNNCLTDWGNLQGRLGFVKEGRMLKDKFNAFASLVILDYEKTKTLLGDKNDYVLYFEFNDQIISNVYGRYSNLSQINADNKIKFTRVVYYDLDGNGRIVNMVVIVF